MELLNYINNKKKHRVDDIIKNGIVILTPTRNDFMYAQGRLKWHLDMQLSTCGKHVWDFYEERSGIYVGRCKEVIIVDYIRDKYTEEEMVDLYNVIWEELWPSY